jgi:hypothetical protein
MDILNTEIDVVLGQNENTSMDIGEIHIIEDHSTLANRDLPSQHPISAIDGLESALDNLAIDSITNAELEEVLHL